MPIAPVPDPLPGNAQYRFVVQLAGTTNQSGLYFDVIWSPFHEPVDNEEDLDAAAQNICDQLSALPGATVQAYKNRSFDQNITPTE